MALFAWGQHGRISLHECRIPRISSGSIDRETQDPREARGTVDAKRFQSLQVEASGSGSLRRTMGPIRSVGEELWTKTGGAFGRIRPMRM